MILCPFQSPRGDFGFLKSHDLVPWVVMNDVMFQSPRGDFGFLKPMLRLLWTDGGQSRFQSPRGDFGFLKTRLGRLYGDEPEWVGFNPLAGILVF
mgnify:CR=1 FL=1